MEHMGLNTSRTLANRENNAHQVIAEKYYNEHIIHITHCFNLRPFRYDSRSFVVS